MNKSLRNKVNAEKKINELLNYKFYAKSGEIYKMMIGFKKVEENDNIGGKNDLGNKAVIDIYNAENEESKENAQRKDGNNSNKKIKREQRRKYIQEIRIIESER